MDIIEEIVNQCYSDQKELCDFYEENEIKRMFNIPDIYSINLRYEFGLEVDREGLQLCNSNLYSNTNSEVVDKESRGICSNYDFWFMVFDMALFPEFKTNSAERILNCAIHYKVYINQLLRFVANNFEKGKLVNKLPYSYRYYQLRTRYLIAMSKFDFHKEVCFVPVRSKIPNASIAKCGDDLYTLKIGVGLEYILDRLTRFVAYAQIETNDYKNVVFENLKIQIVLIALFYYGKITSTQTLGAFLIKFSQMEECRNRRIEQMDFILCHEIGHVYYDNIDSPSNKEIEFQSDKFAIEVLLSEKDNLNIYQRRDKQDIVSSVLILFMELSLVENMYYNICCAMNWELPALTYNHPSYKERYKAILSMVGTLDYIAEDNKAIISRLQKLEELLGKWPDDLLAECVKAQLKINANEMKKEAKENVKNVL